ALKIEDAVKKMDGIKDAHLDFARESLMIEGDLKHIDLKMIQNVAQKVEPDVKVYENNEEVIDKEEVKLSKKDWLIYGLGVILALIGYLFKNILNSNVMDIVAIPFFVSSYIIF